MTLTDSEIKKLKDELLADLRAIERVEEIMAKRNGHSVGGGGAAAAPALEKPNLKQPTLLPAIAGPRGQLIRFVEETFKDAFPTGIRPVHMQHIVKKAGYQFSTDEVCASSVSTAIQRLYKRDGKLEKLDDGSYVWRKEGI